MKLNYLLLFVILLIGISITSCTNQNITTLKPIQEVSTSDKILTKNDSNIEIKAESTKSQKNISSLVLKKDDLPLNESYWSMKFESNDIKGYLGDSDQKSVLGGSIVKYRYHYIDLGQKEFENAFQSFELVHLILEFPLVNNTVQPQTSNLNAYLYGDEKNKFFWALSDAYTNYGLNLYETDGSMRPHEEYPPFNIGEKEFIYSFNYTGEQKLYGIVFTKGGIIEEISIYGFGINLNLLKSLTIQASNKID